MIIVNFKTVEAATGQKALELAKIHQKVASQTGIPIMVAVQATDISKIRHEVNIPIYAQHCDGVTYGSKTGWILPEAIKQAGATGSLLNHSEHRFTSEIDLENAIKRLQELQLTTIVCAETAAEGAEMAKKYNPDFIAIEPPELIGGDISVSTAQPELIENAVKLIGNNVLVGAGVKNAEDVKIALKLGAKGILLASGITKSDDPEAVLKNLASAFM